MIATPDLNEIFDLIDECVIVRNMDGRITGWNRSAETVYRIPRDQAIGLAIDAIFELGPAELAGEWRGDVSRVQRLSRLETRMSVQSKILRDADGCPAAIIETSRPSVAAQANDFLRLFTVSGVAVLSLDATEASELLAGLRSQVQDVLSYLRQNPNLCKEIARSISVSHDGSASHDVSTASLLQADLWPVEITDALIDPIIKVLIDGVESPVSCELRLNGKSVQTEVTAMRGTSKRGEVRILLAVKDVSVARETLAATELRYRQLFDHIPAALVQVDESRLGRMFAQLRQQGVADLATYIDEHPDFLDAAIEALVIEEVNQAGVALFGARSGREIHGSTSRYFQGSGRHALKKSLEARYRGEFFFQQEAKVQRLDDTTIDVLFAASHFTNQPGKSLVAFMDISDRKQAEIALKYSEGRYRDLFQAMKVSFWELDLGDIISLIEAENLGQGARLDSQMNSNHDSVVSLLSSARIVDANDQARMLFGGHEKADLLRTLDHFWPSHTRTDAAAAVLSMLKNDESVTIETRLKRLNDEEFDAQVTLWLSRDDRRRGLVALTDISERVTAFSELEQSEQRFRDLFQHLPIPVMQVNSAGLLEHIKALKREGVVDLGSHILKDPDFIWKAMEGTIIEQANDAALRVLGAAGSIELRGPITPLWRNQPDVYARLLHNHYFKRTAFEEEVTLSTLEGDTREGTMTVTFPPEMWMRGVTINAFVDMTEKKEAERRLRQIEAEHAHAARISMLGELTASIAHEVNQPLAAITTYGEAGLRWLSRPNPELSQIEDIIGRIVADAQRAAGVLARVRNMASRRKLDAEIISLDQLVAEAIHFLGYQFLLHKIEVNHVPSQEPTLVRVDRIQLQQVVVNLAVNAVQAISIANPARKELLMRTVDEGAQVRFSVEDSGPGISPKVFDHIFQSFFTTKDNGMGMGLPISRSIIEAHGGVMAVDNDSQYGGARFSFLLPKAS